MCTCRCPHRLLVQTRANTITVRWMDTGSSLTRCTRPHTLHHATPRRYWYNETSSFGPKGLFQDSALEDGFLKAPNRGKMDFALMWASQEWMQVANKTTVLP